MVFEKRNLFIGIFALVLIGFMIFVMADHVITTSEGGNSYSVNEDVGFIYNITINNSDAGQGANITQVNVTLGGDFNFIPGAFNGTDASLGAENISFTNTSVVLSWTNLTRYVVNGSEIVHFWFNATASTPGVYNITIMTLNSTGAFTSNISVTVNDTTAPGVIISVPGNASTVYASSVNFNLSVTDASSSVDSCWYTLTNGVVNITMSNISSVYYATNSSIADSVYTAKFYCNDSRNNLNNTEQITFTIDSDGWVFNGTVYDINKIAMNNTLVNLTYWVMGNGLSLAGSTSAYSNESGWFELNATGNSSYMYKLIVRHTNSSTSSIDYIGQSLPAFPYREFANMTGLNSYLRTAGTINMTAINSTGDRITFRYQVKDTKLGYSIAEEFSNAVSEVIVYVPRDRNYSVMIYPNQAMPVSFNWNNFTSNSSYDIVTGLSTYNVTTHTVQKTFNSTDNLLRVTGYIQNSTGSDFADWNEFTVVPFLLEPGNMIYLGENAGMPYNMSAWNNGQSDEYNLTNGFYNITLPGPAESATYILFATAKNGSSYYGGYRNITLDYSSSVTDLNFTMYPLMSTDWGSANSNLSLSNPTGAGNINISSARQQFNLVNSSNLTLSNVNAHLEVKVDYTNYNCTEFTFMTDLSSGSASFYIPLLNTSVKEMNIFSQSYAPKRVPAKTAAQILANPNITMSTFNPGDIDGATLSGLQIGLYQSNSTCDVPSLDPSCIIMDSTNLGNFNPLTAVIGGGALSFRMGLLSTGIVVHYVNVDMLASGPPDALFDDSQHAGTTTGNFETAFRFGSNGPTIYDYVLISMPYTEGSTSQTGLNENLDVNMSIPILYDENWAVIWNATANGTTGSALAGNDSHYSTYPSQWGILMGQNNCTVNISEFNSTNPCFINKTSNRIWIRLPHFSGTEPSVTGGVITATSSSSSSSSSSGGGLINATTIWKRTFVVANDKFIEGYTKDLEKNQRMKIEVENKTHYVGVTEITATTIKINVWSDPQEATLAAGDVRRFEVTDDSYYDIQVTLNSISGSKANLTFKSIHEKITEETKANETAKENAAQKRGGESGDETESFIWVYILVGIIVLIIIGVGVGIFKDLK